ncbi:MAG: aminotransferase class I/II-fold pyridoxal phosphate-dependent enzyme [Flavobacterium sp.]|nr:aminotransferase class I/II-fold pyridoxal phosphate-dependent enzyme [Candidatus Neoflavobacterium equi]
MSKKYGIETQLIRNQLERSHYKEHSVPLYLTSSFVFDDSESMRAAFAEEQDQNIYSRFSNPNVTEFVDKLVLLEGAEAGYAFATGMAAVYNTIIPFLNAGDHILSASSIFGSTHTLFTKYLPKWAIETTYFNGNSLDELEGLVQPNTRILFAESPTNPGVDIIDIKRLGSFAAKHNLLLVIDNTFATPLLQQPLSLGADLVVHSGTKLLDGQGRVLGGAVVGRSELVREIYLFSRNTGPALSPFNAWILSKSMETLSLRVYKQSESALRLAHILEQRGEVSFVKYPFLASHPQYALAKEQMKAGGNVISFELVGGKTAGQRFMDALELFSLTANLGDSRSIATHPASTTHSKLTDEELEKAGIGKGLVRLSIGLETFEDIVQDVLNALDKL